MAEQNGTNVGYIEEIQSVVIECVFRERLPAIYKPLAIEVELPTRSATALRRPCGRGPAAPRR